MPDYQIVNNQNALHRARHCGQASSLVKSQRRYWRTGLLGPAAPLHRLSMAPVATSTSGALVEREANLAALGADDRSRLGLLTGIEYAYEGSTGVELLVMVDNVLKGQGIDSLRRKRQRHRGEQTTLERVPDAGVKTTRSVKPRICSISGVAMFTHAVGLRVLVGAAKMGAGVAGLYRRPSRR